MSLISQPVLCPYHPPPPQTFCVLFPTPPRICKVRQSETLAMAEPVPAETEQAADVVPGEFAEIVRRHQSMVFRS